MAETDNTVYAQPSVRSATTWTPALVRAARIAADGGHLSRAAELCDDMLGDDRIAGVLGTLAESLLSVDVGFDEGLRRGRRKRVTGEDRSDIILALEDDGDWWQLLPEEQAKQFIIWGRLLGCAPGQIVYPDRADPQRDGRMVPTVEFWHPKNLRWDTQLRKWFIRVDDYGQEVEFTPGDGQWVLYTPGGPFRPWASGLWRGLALWWLLKQYARDDLGNLGQNASRAAAEDTEPRKPEDRRQLASSIYSAARNGVIVLPKGVSLKLLGVGAGTKEVYEFQIAAADEAISISAVGQNLTTKVEGGSYAAARVHGQVRGQVVSSVGESFATWAHDQVLTGYAEINWGSRVLAPWPVFDTEPPEDMGQAADVLTKVASAVVQLSQINVALDLEELGQRFRIPFAADQPVPAAPVVPEPTAEPALAAGPQKPAQAPPKANALASGDSPRAAVGFVEGQTYADALTDHGIRGSAELLSPTVARLLALVDGVEDLESARAKLLDLYEAEPDPDELAAQAEKLFVLAELAGIASVAQDAPESKEPA